LPPPAPSTEEWAVLGHEFGRWRLSTVRDHLRDGEDREFVKLGSFATPDELVAQLRKPGTAPRSDRAEWNGLPVVTVRVDGKLRLRFVTRRYCRDAPYDL
jgi:hypothetical protein